MTDLTSLTSINIPNDKDPVGWTKFFTNRSLVSFLRHIPPYLAFMKKVMRTFDAAMYDLIGESAFKDRPPVFRYIVEVLIVGIVVFIFTNLLKLYL